MAHRIGAIAASVALTGTGWEAPAASERAHRAGATLLAGPGIGSGGRVNRLGRRLALRLIRPHAARQASIDSDIIGGLQALCRDVRVLGDRSVMVEALALRSLREAEDRLRDLVEPELKAGAIRTDDLSRRVDGARGGFEASSARIDDLVGQIDDLRAELRYQAGLLSLPGQPEVAAGAYPAAPDEPWSQAYEAAHAAFVGRALDDEALVASIRDGQSLPPGYGAGFDERVVEIPWLAGFKLRGSVLDAGSTLNHLHILRRLRPRMDELHIVAPAPEDRAFPSLGISYLVRRPAPAALLRTSVYDLVLVCFSTLEHVGMDLGHSQLTGRRLPTRRRRRWRQPTSFAASCGPRGALFDGADRRRGVLRLVAIALARRAGHAGGALRTRRGGPHLLPPRRRLAALRARRGRRCALPRSSERGRASQAHRGGRGRRVRRAHRVLAPRARQRPGGRSPRARGAAARHARTPAADDRLGWRDGRDIVAPCPVPYAREAPRTSGAACRIISTSTPPTRRRSSSCRRGSSPSGSCWTATALRRSGPRRLRRRGVRQVSGVDGRSSRARRVHAASAARALRHVPVLRAARVAAGSARRRGRAARVPRRTQAGEARCPSCGSGLRTCEPRGFARARAVRVPRPADPRAGSLARRRRARTRRGSGATARSRRRCATGPGTSRRRSEVFVVHPPTVARSAPERGRGRAPRRLPVHRKSPRRRQARRTCSSRRCAVRADVKLKIAGTGPEARARCERSAGGDRDRAPRQGERRGARRPLRARAGVAFVPHDEDFGLVVLEAMQAGRPVITCTDSGGPRELVEDGVTGLVVDPERRGGRRRDRAAVGPAARRGAWATLGRARAPRELGAVPTEAVRERSPPHEARPGASSR